MSPRAFRLSIAVAAVVALAAGAWAWRQHRAAPPEGQPIAEAEVEVRVGGPGTVQARIPVTLSARIQSQVVSLHADHGERVKRGQLLAVLDDRDLAAKRAAAAAAAETVERNIAAAQASHAKALADLELARSRERRDAELVRSGFISKASFETSALGAEAARAAVDNAQALLSARRSEARTVAEELRYAGTVLSHTRILAPMDGLVVQRAAEVGNTVAPGQTLFRIVDPATLWISARIDEALAGRLEPGMPARIRLRSGEEHAGRVARISRQSDAATRELEVNVAFDAPPERFAIDQEAEVSILAGRERGPAVPVAALVRREGRLGILVLRDGKAVFQPVKVKASDERHALLAEAPGPDTRLAPWTSR